MTMGLNAIPDAIGLLALVELWEPWIGLLVNLAKSSSANIDYATSCQVDADAIRYRLQPLPSQKPDQPFRYLGMLLTLTLD